MVSLDNYRDTNNYISESRVHYKKSRLVNLRNYDKKSYKVKS